MTYFAKVKQLIEERGIGLSRHCMWTRWVSSRKLTARTFTAKKEKTVPWHNQRECSHCSAATPLLSGLLPWKTHQMLSSVLVHPIKTSLLLSPVSVII